MSKDPSIATAKATDYVFTFETNNDLLREMCRNHYFEYYCVRVLRECADGCTIDFPCKSRQDLQSILDRYRDAILNIYPTKHFEELPLYDY